MTMTLANCLTLSRLVLVPVFLIAFIKGAHIWAFAFFCIAAATDMIDGTVARKFSRPSRWGAMVDPIADKCLVQSCFIALGVVGVLPWWFVIFALVRDVMITGGILYLIHENAELPYRPAMVSKFATLFQLLVAIVGLITVWKPTTYLLGRGIEVWLMWAVYAAVVLIFLSGVKYIVMGIEILKQHRTKHA